MLLAGLAQAGRPTCFRELSSCCLVPLFPMKQPPPGRSMNHRLKPPWFNHPSLIKPDPASQPFFFFFFGCPGTHYVCRPLSANLSNCNACMCVCMYVCMCVYPRACVSVCVYACTHITVLADNLQESLLSSHRVGPGCGTEIFGLGVNSFSC